MLFWLLALLFVFAVASGWNIVLKISVIVVAISLISTVVIRFVTRK